MGDCSSSKKLIAKDYNP